MRWQDRERSTNVEDRRRASPGPVAMGGGIGTILLLVVMYFMGADPKALLDMAMQGGQEQGSTAPGAPGEEQNDEMKQFVSVVLADTDRSAKSVVEAFRSANVNILVQEFIKEAGGTDIRCLVVGGKVVAAMQRTGAEGEFRSNLHRGGSAQAIKISSVERTTAVNAAKSMGLNVCGVDLLRANHGPVVMEVNSSPGLEGVEKATGKDIAGMIIEFIEKSAKPGRTRTRGEG